MRRTTTLAGLVLALAPSCVPLERVEPARNYVRYHALWRDEERLDALKEFYETSLTAVPQGRELAARVILLKTVLGDPKNNDINYAHGILLDDCGLILTSDHVADKMVNNATTSSTARFANGEEYPATRTEFSKWWYDYGIVVAETGKKRRSHPLCFAELPSLRPGQALGYMAYNPSYLSRKIPLPVLETHRGEVATQEATHAAIMAAKWPTKQTFAVAEEMRDMLTFQAINRDAILTTLPVHYGHSGSPVFTQDGKFGGLVKGACLNIHTEDYTELVPNVGFITAAPNILRGIRNYLYDEGIEVEQKQD